MAVLHASRYNRGGNLGYDLNPDNGNVIDMELEISSITYIG